MKKLILVLVLVGMLATSVFADAFIIRNSTESVFLFVYVSDSRLTDWGNDILGNQVLSPRETLRVTTPIPIGSTTWDIRIIDDDGDTYTVYNRRIRDGETITVTYADLD